MFAFRVGQVVRAVADVQGLEKSKTYTVRRISSKSTQMFGTFVTYVVEPVMQSVKHRVQRLNPSGLLSISNGHLVLEDATALAAAEKFEQKLAAKQRRPHRDARRSVEQSQAEVESAPSLVLWHTKS